MLIYTRFVYEFLGINASYGYFDINSKYSGRVYYNGSAWIKFRACDNVIDGSFKYFTVAKSAIRKYIINPTFAFIKSNIDNYIFENYDNLDFFYGLGCDAHSCHFFQSVWLNDFLKEYVNKNKHMIIEQIIEEFNNQFGFDVVNECMFEVLNLGIGRELRCDLYDCYCADSYYLRKLLEVIGG